MKENISTIEETNKNNVCEHEQVCHNYIHYWVKYWLNECKFFCMKNNMACVIEGGIHFGPFRVLWGDTNVENIGKFKLAHVRGFHFDYLMTPNHSVLV